MNPYLSFEDPPLLSTEIFTEPSTPKTRANPCPSSPFSQFCMNALSPIPANYHSPSATPVRAPYASPLKIRPQRTVQKINFSAIESKIHLQASCVSVEIKVIPDSPEIPKIRPRKKSQDKAACCNCQKSRCLKLYCDCFSLGQFCSDCTCSDCLNRVENEEARKEAMSSILEKNPEAFRPKIAHSDDRVRHQKGCNCKRSGCMKRYCECYQSSIKCSEVCKCTGCNNKEGGSNGRRRNRGRVKNEKNM